MTQDVVYQAKVRRLDNYPYCTLSIPVKVYNQGQARSTPDPSLSRLKFKRNLTQWHPEDLVGNLAVETGKTYGNLTDVDCLLGIPTARRLEIVSKSL